MNIFNEISTKLSAKVRKHSAEPADHERPQDEIPNERVLHFIVSDYRRMYNERGALIAYIHSLEAIYKETQTRLFKDTISTEIKKKRLVADVRQILFDTTNDHIKAQERLRQQLRMEE